MASIALERSDVIVGVDTHKREHVAVAVDGLGGRLGELTVRTNKEGYAQVAAWASNVSESFLPQLAAVGRLKYFPIWALLATAIILVSMAPSALIPSTMSKAVAPPP